MEFSVNQSDFSRELSLAQGSVEKKVTIPMLGNVLLKADNNRLEITATDLAIGFHSSVPADVSVPGSVAIPGAKLQAHIKSLPEGEKVRVKVGDTYRASITCGRNRAIVAGVGPDEFPALPEFTPAKVSLEASYLSRLLGRVAFAINDDPVKFITNGAFFWVSDTGIEIRATNMKLLAHAGMEWQTDVEEEFGFVLPQKAVVELQRQISGAVPVGIHLADNRAVAFSYGDRRFSSQLIDGSFPAYTPPTNLLNRALLPASSLKDALGRVARFADDYSKAVILEFTENGLCLLAAASSSGESEESMEINYAGAPLRIKVNAKYLHDFLKVADDNPIEVFFKDSNSATEWRIEGDPEYRVIIALMALEGQASAR